MRIIGVNGIRSHGRDTTDRLLAQLHYRGFNTYDVRQPMRHIWDARSKKKREADAMGIVRIAKDGDVLVAHSYGCLKSAIAMQHINFRAVYLFRPAMSRNYEFPDSDTQITGIYSAGDRAIWLGGMLRFGHPFGWAGTRGFKARRVINLRSEGHHNADFRPFAVSHWANYIQWDLDNLCKT